MKMGFLFASYPPSDQLFIKGAVLRQGLSCELLPSIQVHAKDVFAGHQSNKPEGFSEIIQIF